MSNEIRNQQYCNCPPIRGTESTNNSKISNKELEKVAFEELHEDVRAGRITAEQADAMGAMVKAAINMQGQRTEQASEQCRQPQRHNNHASNNIE